MSKWNCSGETSLPKVWSSITVHTHIVLKLVERIVYCILCSGSGNRSAGGAAAGLGWGDSGWGSCSSLGEALVPWGPDGWHHCALYVSPFYCLLRHELLCCWAHCWHSTHFLPLKYTCNRKCLHWTSCVALDQNQVHSPLSLPSNTLAEMLSFLTFFIQIQKKRTMQIRQNELNFVPSLVCQSNSWAAIQVKN